MAKDKMTQTCKVLVVGGSAGSLDVLLKVVPQLHQIAFAMVIVLHRKPAEDSTLEELLAAKTAIPLKEVEDKILLLPGYIYIAPSDYHLLFEKNHTLSLDISEKINHSRPSIDVSFESAADVYGGSLAGLLLSGANSDGTAGLIAIKNAGGIVAVQDPKTAEMPYMPGCAVSKVDLDHILDINGIVSFITALS